jgi:DNA-binding LacI/PurR family transcriptional regulator
VDQFLSEMGYIATQMLIKLVNNEPLEVQVHKTPTKLVKRKSCRALENSN